jgi:hypothetical protein
MLLNEINRDMFTPGYGFLTAHKLDLPEAQYSRSQIQYNLNKSGAEMGLYC